MSDYAAQRLNMVEAQVRANDVTDTRLQRAMLDTPREDFVPADRRAVAYMEGCVPVKAGRWLLDPRSFAKLAQLASVQPSDAILDVGCATGYSTAILAQLGGSVWGLEQDPELHERAAGLLARFPNARIARGNLAEGLSRETPYDVIFVNGSCEQRPQALLDQLKDGGRLVCILSTDGPGRGHLFVRADGAVSDRAAFDASVPVLPGFARVPTFAF
jgi:protein-L-isoaspartate(D-aspartate) O-methyltransferase